MVLVAAFLPYQHAFVAILSTISILFILMKLSLFTSCLFKLKEKSSRKQQTQINHDNSKCGLSLIHFTLFLSISLFSASTYITLCSILYDLEGLNRCSGILYLIAQWLMLITFILRLHITFKGSIMAYSKLTIYLLYTACSTCFILLLMIGICFYFKMNIIVLSMLMVIWLIMYISFILLLVILFLRKIENCMIMVFKQNISDVCNHGITMKKDELLDINIINSIIKYSLLVSISIITSCTSYIVCITLYYQYHESYLKNISFTMAMFDGLISSICLYLFYPPNNKIYYKVCALGHAMLYQLKLYQILYCFDLSKEERQEFREIMM